MTPERRDGPDGGMGPGARAKWVLVAFLAIAAYFLITEHRAHLYGWLTSYGIWLLLLACPLLHLFMHGGHGHDGHSDHQRREPGDKRE